MDKARFVAVAPVYYALAIVAYFWVHEDAEISDDGLQSKYEFETEEGDEALLPHAYILGPAISWLADRGVIELVRDDMAPLMILKGDLFTDKILELGQDRTLPFAAFLKIQNKPAWIYNVLGRLEEIRRNLHVGDVDFLLPVNEWAPIPLDRDEPELRTAIEAVDEAIEQTRGDNGYAEYAPEERSYVLDGLSALSRRLKEAGSISMTYIRQFGIEPLMILTKRFAKSALDLSVAAAREALKAWMKKHGLDWLNHW